MLLQTLPRFVLALGIGLLIASQASAISSSPIESALQRLEAAMAAHPDDPDLEWAYATTLSRSGQADRAATRLERYAERWPNRRDDVDFTLGRVLFEAGRPGEALPHLAKAVQNAPDSGVARFYYALALRELDRRDEARSELVRAARLAPELYTDATLLLSIDAFAQGDEAEGVRFAQDVIRTDPESDAAARARMLLREKDLAATRRPWRADGYAGFEYDDNVTLESDRSDVAASDRDDFKEAWGAGLAWRHVFTDDLQGIASYRFDQAFYEELSDFDYINNALHQGVLYKLNPGLALRVDAIGWNTRQDGDNYLWAGTVRPSVLVALPQRWGLMRVFASAEYRGFEDDPFDASLEQDGWTLGTGVEWNVGLPWIDGTTSISAAFNETLTEAETTPSAAGDFKGDYDVRTLRLHHRLRVALPFQFQFGSDVTYSRGWYLHNNFGAVFTDFLLLPIDEIEVRKRRDHYVSGRVFVGRELFRYVRAEIEYKPRRRFSNLGLYDYESHAGGLVIRIQSD